MAIGTSDTTETREQADSVLGGAAPGAHVTVFHRVLNRAGTFWTLAIFVLLVVILGVVNHDIFTKAAWLATAGYAVEYAVLSVGQTFVMITGEIDISSGAILGFTGMAGAYFMTTLTAHHVGPYVATFLGILVFLAVGAGCGLLNGFLIVQFKVPSFIVTLGTMLAIGYGAVNLITGGFEVGNLPSPFNTIGSASYLDGWLPLTVLITLVLGIVTGLVLGKTRFGLHTYMLGSSRLAARRVGINARRHVPICFVLSGLLAGLAGLLVTASLTVASPNTGQNDELYAITAVVIGGASLSGGRGGISAPSLGWPSSQSSRRA